MYDPYNPYADEKQKIDVNFKRTRISTKKSGVGTVNAGGAIIIIIFVVLCLTIFGLLSFATAFADKKLADKNLQNVSHYYEADSIAEEKLAMIYEAVYNKAALTSGPEGFFDEDFVWSALDDIKGEIYIWEPCNEDTGDNNNTVMVSYITYMADSENSEVRYFLCSEIELYYNPDTRTVSYKITEWRVITETDFDYGGNVGNLWMPEFDDDDDGDDGDEDYEGLFDFWNFDDDEDEEEEE